MKTSHPLNVGIAFVTLLYLSVAATAALAGGAHDTLRTHPSLWPLTTSNGHYSWTAKRFKAGVRKPVDRYAPHTVNNVEHSIMWAWSGRNNKPPEANERDVHYSSPKGNSPDCYANNSCIEWNDFEWEYWTYDWFNPKSATNFQYAGRTPSVSHWIYSSQAGCEGGNNPGYVYPNLDPGQNFNFVPISVKDPGPDGYPFNNGCRPEYQSSGNDMINANGGGFIGIYRFRNGNGQAPYYESRVDYCTDYFKRPYPHRYQIEDPTSADIAYQICLNAPLVDTLFQVYVWGGESAGGGSAVIGCEAVVYVSGYDQPLSSAAPDSQAVKNWFRNGELRLSRWYQLPSSNITKGPADRNHWITACNDAFSPNVKENWFYTGVYKLNNTYFQDWGKATGSAYEYKDDACPHGWKPNSSGSCDPQEGAEVFHDESCPANHYGQNYVYGSTTKMLCMSNFP
ncbi:MAG: hypothetical protein KZQ95_20115 [Candidatus Thiodiazotropha sp. (ex Epidulcina cf. delphinae)]|nr:hypothetical protein [Candidatus Thiodiazotropha sp. (ex Epidulcina cf. delphinae)]